MWRANREQFLTKYFNISKGLYQIILIRGNNAGDHAHLTVIHICAYCWLLFSLGVIYMEGAQEVSRNSDQSYMFRQESNV